MNQDPRTPVIIGVAQRSRPLDDTDLAQAPDAVTMMADALTEAIADTGGHGVAGAIDTIGVVGGLWRYRDPARLVAEELALTQPIHTVLTSMGGNTPIQFVHDLVERVAQGTVDVAAVLGGETNLTRRAQKAAGIEPVRRVEQGAEADEQWGPQLRMGDTTAVTRGGEHPRNSYAVLESALRAGRGESHDQCRERGSNLWARYARAATQNPHAADRSGMNAEEIRTPTETNRMVSWPYTKAMCANNNVDQAGAIIVASTAAADRLGVPADRRVYPHACVVSADTASPLERAGFPAAPGLEAGARAVVDAAGSRDALDHVELYSCFPSVVTMTADALSLDPDAALSVCGGLAFAGAPLNFAAGQGLIAMVQRLRDDAGTLGLVQGNGGHVSKNAFGLYSTRPPDSAHRLLDLGPVGDTVEPAEPDRAGDATIDGVTVEFGHFGPDRAVAIVRFDDGRRTWANSEDPDLLRRFTEEEWVGRTVRVHAGVMTV